MQFYLPTQLTDWLLIGGLTIFSFVLGMLWHNPSYALGRIWVKANYPQGTPSKDLMNLPLMFGGTAIAHGILTLVLWMLLHGKGAVDGALQGILLALAFVFTTMGPTYFFAGRSPKLWVIDSGFYMILFALDGLMFGIWGIA